MTRQGVMKMTLWMSDMLSFKIFPDKNSYRPRSLKGFERRAFCLTMLFAVPYPGMI